jgi:hypothetical protein
VRSVSIHLDPSQFLAGWQEKSGTVFVPTLSESRVGDEAAVRIGIHGHAIRATLFGKVALVRRIGRPALPPGVELQLDKHSLPAARFLAMAARGEPIAFQERSPRWTAVRQIHLEREGMGLEVTTVNLSDGGCAVAWPGTLPGVGEEVSVRLKEGFFSRSVRAVVCWNQPGRGAFGTVGLKMISEGRGRRGWRALVEAVARSGARAT